MTERGSVLKLAAVAFAFVLASGLGSWLIMGGNGDRPDATTAKAPVVQPSACRTAALQYPLGNFESFGYPKPGFYRPSAKNAPNALALTHALQHGWTVAKYRADLPERTIRRLRGWQAAQRNDKLVVSSGGTRMPWQMMASGPSGRLWCDELDEQAFDDLQEVLTVSVR